MPVPAVSPAEAVGMCSNRLERVRELARGYVNRHQLPNSQVIVARAGKVVLHDVHGYADVANQVPLRPDSIFRIYSQTKPITCVAAMICYERGCFQLDNPVEMYLPEFADMKVFVSGSADDPVLEPAAEKMTIKHLFCHLSGVSWPLGDPTDPLSTIYKKRLGPSNDVKPAGNLAEYCKRLAQCPLVAQPGALWHYGEGITVLGRLVEVWSSMRFDAFVQQEIFGPLQMLDTSFKVPEDKRHRFIENYFATPTQEPKFQHASSAPMANAMYFEQGGVPNGSGGLVGTASDYLRFAQMLLNKGELDGVRILGTRSVEFMTTNHLPNNCDIAAMGVKSFTETTMDGIGFGFGMGVVIDPAKAELLCSVGEFYWGGIASTFFFVDPKEKIVLVFLTQLVPSSAYPIRRNMRVAVRQAILDDPPIMSRL